MALTVRPARTARERREFFELPYALHAEDPIWTPPLLEDLKRSLSDENPLWQEGRGERELLLAFDGEEVVGRVLCHVHHASNSVHHERAGFFGLLECPDELAIARALLDEAGERHRRRGLTDIRGPYELTISQCMGAVVHGFEEPAAFSQSWNAPHIPRLLEAIGFRSCYRLATFRVDDLASVDPDALLGEKHRAWTSRPGIHLRTFDLKHFERDARAAVDLLNDSFADNFGFVGLSGPEVDFMVGPMKRVVRPEITVFLELDGRPAGVAMALPDFNVLARRIDGRLLPLGWARFLLGARALDMAQVQFIATRPDLQNQGLMRIVVAELVRRLQAAGFRSLDGTWIGESNPKSRAQALAVGMREKHQLALYTRPL